MNLPAILQGWPIEAVVAIVAGIVVLLMPRVLNYAVAVYLLVVGALARRESRGGHFREDYPTRDDEQFMQHTMAYRAEAGAGFGGSEVRLDYKPVVMTRYQPMERKY